MTWHIIFTKKLTSDHHKIIRHTRIGNFFLLASRGKGVNGDDCGRRVLRFFGRRSSRGETKIPYFSIGKRGVDKTRYSTVSRERIRTVIPQKFVEKVRCECEFSIFIFIYSFFFFWFFEKIKKKRL